MVLKRNRRGSVILPNGERISLAEQKALRSAVSSANKKRNARIYGVDNNFVKSKKSARLTSFRNKKEFNTYLRYVQKIAMTKANKTNRGSYILPNGQYVTISEQKALRSAVNSANRKRKRMLERLPAEAKAKYKDFGIESDFVMRKKSTSLKRFRNKNEFKHYLKSVQKIASGEFERKRIMTYKENYIRALRNTFNSSAKEAIKAVREMDLKTFRQKVESEELEEIGYVYYDPNGEKLTRISQQLGLA